MTNGVREITLAHELDAAWIITLWKLIHGGDPSPEAVAAEAIAALAQYLHPAESSFTFAQLQKQFASVGVQVTERTEEAGAKAGTIEEPKYPVSRQYCFKLGGQTICTLLPPISHRVVSA